MTKRIPRLASIALMLGLSLNATVSQAATATRAAGFVYDASGLLLKEIIEPGNSQLCLVTEYTYDTFGNKISATVRNCNGSAGEAAAPAAGSDALIAPRATTSTYDAQGRFAVSSSNALGHTETRTYDARFGGITGLTGPNGLPTSWTYDSFGRKTLETRADGTTSSWAYNQPCDLGNGDLTNAVYCVAEISSGTSRYTRTYYDALDRKLATTHIDFTNTVWIDEGRVDYDALGRVAKSYLPYKRGSFATAKYTTALYDLYGRVTSQTAPDGSTTTSTYGVLTTTVTNSLNQSQITTKNSQGQVASVRDAANKTISYTYDPFGNLTQTIDALGNTTTISYDARGRRASMNDPDLGVWSYAYNVVGELIRQTDAKGQVVAMQYDKLGRMVSRAEPDLNSTWTYDTATRGVGKLASATSGNGYSRTHSYDTVGRPSSTSTVIDNAAAPYVTSMTYDSAGRIETQTYPASATHPTGFAVKNVYNTVGHLVEVRNNATNALYWQANSRDEMGNLRQQTYGNGVVTTQVYDMATGRITQQLAGAGNGVQNMSYTYDSLGNLQTRTDVNSNLTETFAYDNINRVTVATATSGAINTSATFAYDAIGNITGKSDVGSYAYNASGAGSVRPHAVAGITGTINGVVNPAFAYDANGNMVSGAGRTTTWTSFNMPSQIVNGTKTTGFLYNPEHERTREAQADGSIIIVLSPRYDTGLHFEKKYLATNGVLNGSVKYEHYLYAGGIMFGQYATVNDAAGVTTSTEVKYYSKDHLGSIVAITDQAGAVMQRLSYDVWGKRRYPNGATDPNGLLNNPDMYHGYTGHEMLDEMGLIHMNGRLYDPLLAKFVSADPYVQAPTNLQSYNRYAYVWNNPLAAADPSGYSAWTKIRGVVKVVIGVVCIAYGEGDMFANAVGIGFIQSGVNDLNGDPSMQGVGGGVGVSGNTDGSGTNVYVTPNSDGTPNSYGNTESNPVISGNASEPNSRDEQLNETTMMDILYKVQAKWVDSMYSNESSHSAAGTASFAYLFSQNAEVSQSATSRKVFDKAKAVNHLNANAADTSQGRCAMRVREAIQAGGIVLTRTNHAKDYGPSLSEAGFTKIDSADYNPQTADVVVIQSTSRNKSGHMEMYNGTIWVSDFRQRNDIYPGPAYRREKPAYEIFRYE